METTGRFDCNQPGLVYLRAGSLRAWDKLSAALASGRGSGPRAAGSCSWLQTNAGPRYTCGLRRHDLFPATPEEAARVLSQKIPGVTRARVPKGERLLASMGQQYHRGIPVATVWPEMGQTQSAPGELRAA